MSRAETISGYLLDQHDGDDKIELERKHMQATIAALKKELADRNTVLDETQQKLETATKELESTKAELHTKQKLIKMESVLFEEKIVDLEKELEVNVSERRKSEQSAKELQEQLSSILWMAKPQPGPLKPSKLPGLEKQASRPKSTKPRASKES